MLEHVSQRWVGAGAKLRHGDLKLPHVRPYRKIRAGLKHGKAAYGDVDKLAHRN